MMKNKKLKIKYSFFDTIKLIGRCLNLFQSKNFVKVPVSRSSGFTLVELLIYSAVFAVTVGLLTGLLITITGVQTRESAAFEVTRQLQFVTQRMQHTIRDASVISEVFEGADPATPCVQFCSIRLRVANPALDPTIITSDVGGIYIQEGLNPRSTLTAPDTRVTSLRFTRAHNPGGLSTVTIDLALVFNPDDPQLRVERRLASGIAHVSAATFNADVLPDTSGARNIGGVNLRWNNLILSGGVQIVGPTGAGDHIGISMARGTAHGESRIIQYYATATPRDRFGTRFEVGGTAILHLEGDMGDPARRAYFLNSNVGIGTATPIFRTEIFGPGQLTANLTDAGARGNLLAINAGTADFGSGGALAFGNIQSIAANSLGWAAIKGMLIDGSGRTTGDLAFSTRNATGDTSLTERMRITAAGNVGIGTGAPGTHRLHVVGTAGLTTGTAWTNTSDRRWKNVQDEIKGVSLSKILALRPVSYTWNNLHQGRFGANPGLNYGFIAQEIKDILPEMVSLDDDGYYWYNPSGMEAVLTAAIQEQQKIIDTKRQEINEMRARLDKMDAKLSAER